MGYLPTLNAVGFSGGVRKQTAGFSGLNLTGNATEAQFTDCENISTSALPSVLVREKTKLVKQVTSINELSVKAFHMTDSICSLATDFLTCADCVEYPFSGQPYKYIMGGRVGKYLKKDFSAVKFKGYIVVPYYNSDTKSICLHLLRKDPGMNASIIIAKDIEESVDHIHIAAFNNRLLCAYGDGVWICYEDDLMVWDKFYVEGAATADGINEAACQNIPIATGGHFTACTYYKDKPIIFKERAMYALYGSYTPFSVVKIADIGCISHQSIQVVGDEMIFLSENGLMAYSGGTPYCISDNIPDIQYQDIKGCCATDRYYFINEYMYDIKKKCFTKLENRLTPLCSYRDRVFFYDYSSKQVFEMTGNDDESDERIEWSFTTRVYHENTAEKKQYSAVKLRAEPLEDAVIKVEYSVDGGGFETALLESFQRAQGRVLKLNLPLCDSFRLRVSGFGRVKIPFIEREYRTIWGE